MMPSNMEKTIHQETMVAGGFVQKLESGTIDPAAFQRLMAALDNYRRAVHGSDKVSRLIAACLFDLPWELENQSEHFFRRYGKEPARQLSSMAEQLRSKLIDVLWEGLESYYEHDCHR